MGKRLVVFVGLLGFLASSQVASACQKCKRAGFICNGYDECDVVWTCDEVHFGGGGGKNDCDADYSGCFLSGEFCQWAAKTSPLEKDQVFAPLCHETKS